MAARIVCGGRDNACVAARARQIIRRPLPMNSLLPRPAALLLALAIMSTPLPAAENFAAASATLAVAVTKPAGDFLAYFGTGRGGANTGFSVASFNSDTGALSIPTVSPTAAAPSIFIFSPDGRHLYTCYPGRTFQGEPGGGVGAFAVDRATGALT